MTKLRDVATGGAVRGLVAAGALKGVLWLTGPPVRHGALVAWLDTGVTLAIVALLAIVLARPVGEVRRRLLWRVRRKLFLSYVFIGLIPVVLVSVFFLLAGALAMLTASSYLVARSLDSLVTEAGLAADAVSGDVDGMRTRAELEALQRMFGARHPGLRLSVTDAPPPVGALRPVGEGAARASGVAAPGWLEGDRFDGLVGFESRGGMLDVARALRLLPEGRVVMIDIPLGDAVWARVFEETGARVDPTLATPDAPLASDLSSFEEVPWFSFVRRTVWETGEIGLVDLQTVVSPGAFYTRVFGAQTRIGDVSLGYAFLVALAAVAMLFLVIEGTALVMGVALARSITGSIHELFLGTAHVRRGNLGHRIVVETRDQLGELAESFNAMTGSVRNLLREVAEKKRLEEELRIARRIQMSLLPRDAASIPGVSVAAACVPAREVGGDYYDFIRLGDRRLAVLVADVSGKGTSAALYMAELKGMILSLSRVHQSPREMLIEVNRIIAPHIDSRSFITMTYAVLDLEQGALTYCRAGHTPLIYLRAGEPCARQLTPSGLVVGLDGFQTTFEELIDEQTLSIGPGDVAALFTDGISEAMNEQEDLFGEDRLGRLLETHRGLSVAELREHVLQGVTTFVGGADQHDDMTIVLLKVDPRPVAEAGSAA